jgi:hypothetical protein
VPELADFACTLRYDCGNENRIDAEFLIPRLFR